MADDDFEKQVVAVRSRLPVAAKHFDAKDVERVAFDVAGRRDVALDLWDQARDAADEAWRECRRRLRWEYGARNPHAGWSTFVLFAAVLSGAFSAALAAGLRSDPYETEGILFVLATISGLGDLIVLIAVGWRPLNWGMVRMQIGIAVALAVAAAFQLTRPAMPVAPLVFGAGAIGIAGLILALLARALRPAEREEIDTAINVAVDRMRPEVDAIAARLQAETLEKLSAQEQERIVALRTAALVDLAALGDPQSAVEEVVPAGGVIISAFLVKWNSYLRRE